MAVIEAELEGRISAAVAVGSGAELMVVGVRVSIAAGIPVVTPTKSLTIAELLDPLPFPGLAGPGFVGGTGIVSGTFDTATGVLTAAEVEAEPAENLLSGALTAVVPPAINGVPVDLLPATEPRLPGGVPLNEFGFAVVMDNRIRDTLATANGYFDGTRFHAYSLEVDPSAELIDPNPQASILRAEFREQEPADEEGDDFDIRGAVTMGHVAAGVTRQRIEVFRLDAGVATLLGETEARQDGEFPLFARWRLTGATDLTIDPALGQSPLRVRVVNRSAGANNATAEANTVRR